MKAYIVTYIVKKDKKETLDAVAIQAKNKAEACRLCKQTFKEDTGMNAFTPKAYEREPGMTVDTVLTEAEYRQNYEAAVSFSAEMEKLEKMNVGDYVVDMYRKNAKKHLEALVNLTNHAIDRGYTFDAVSKSFRDPEADYYRKGAN